MQSFRHPDAYKVYFYVTSSEGGAVDNSQLPSGNFSCVLTRSQAERIAPPCDELLKLHLI